MTDMQHLSAPTAKRCFITEGEPALISISVLVSKRYCLFFICKAISYVTPDKGVALTQNTLFLFSCKFTLIVQGLQLAKPLFITFSLDFACIFQLFWLYQVFCKP